MFKIVVLVGYLAAPGLTESRFASAAVSKPFNSRAECLYSLNHQGTGVQLGLRIRAASKQAIADGSVLESVQISCRKT